jgi:hypothetical protein
MIHTDESLADLVTGVEEYQLPLAPSPFQQDFIFLRASAPQVRVTLEEREKFQRLREQWAFETAATSSTTEIVMHPSHFQIIGMGKPALPLILAELDGEPLPWFWALTAIAGEDPAEHALDYDEAKAAWLAWGRKKGYLEPPE